MPYLSEMGSTGVFSNEVQPFHDIRKRALSCCLHCMQATICNDKRHSSLFNHVDTESPRKNGGSESACEPHTVRNWTPVISSLFNPHQRSDPRTIMDDRGWKFAQCFGDKGDVDEITEADIISTVEFDHSGDYLATGDKGGRVVLFERNDTVRSFHAESMMDDVRNAIASIDFLPNFNPMSPNLII